MRRRPDTECTEIEGKATAGRKERFFRTTSLFWHSPAPDAANELATPPPRPPGEGANGTRSSAEHDDYLHTHSEKWGSRKAAPQPKARLGGRSFSTPLPKELVEEARATSLHLAESQSLPLESVPSSGAAARSTTVSPPSLPCPPVSPSPAWAYEVIGRNYRGVHSMVASKGIGGGSMVLSGPLSDMTPRGPPSASSPFAPPPIDKLHSVKEEITELLSGPLRSLALAAPGNSADRLVRAKEGGEDAAARDVAAAAMRLRQLSKGAEGERRRMVEAGVLGPLVALLAPNTPETTAENVVLALFNLSLDASLHASILEAGAVGPLVCCLTRGTPPDDDQGPGSGAASAEEPSCGATSACGEGDGRDGEGGCLPSNAALALFNLSATDENKLLVAGAGAVPPLLEMLKWRWRGPRGDAALALFALSIHPAVALRIIEAGGVATVLEQCRRFRCGEGGAAGGEQTTSVATLSNLARIPQGCDAIARHKHGIVTLVEALEDGEPRTQEDAAATLLLLCMHDTPRVCPRLRRECFIPTLIGLAVRGRPRCRAKARALLPYLSESPSSELPPAAVPCPLHTAPDPYSVVA